MLRNDTPYNNKHGARWDGWEWTRGTYLLLLRLRPHHYYLQLTLSSPIYAYILRHATTTTRLLSWSCLSLACLSGWLVWLLLPQLLLPITISGLLPLNRPYYTTIASSLLPPSLYPPYTTARCCGCHCVPPFLSHPPSCAPHPSSCPPARACFPSHLSHLP